MAFLTSFRCILTHMGEHVCYNENFHTRPLSVVGDKKLRYLVHFSTRESLNVLTHSPQEQMGVMLESHFSCMPPKGGAW